MSTESMEIIIGGHIVKEETVIIPSKGWACMIENGTDPIDIVNEDFIHDGLPHVEPGEEKLIVY